MLRQPQYLLAARLNELIYIRSAVDMSFSIAAAFERIPQQDYDLAVNSGILLGSAVAIFYLFFGRLTSIPELVSITLRKPTSTSSRETLVVVSGFVFVSAIVRTLYHEHLTNFYPFDDELYVKKISTLRLILSGALVGLGSQYAITGSENSGILGLPTFSLRSLLSIISVFGTTMLTVTNDVYKWLPKTPRLLDIANQSLPRNISFDAYLLTSLLIPFICFLVSNRKTMKGMIECLLHFAVGIMIGSFLMLLRWSQIGQVIKTFRFSKDWTAQIVVSFVVAMLLFAVVFAIVKYGFKKPLFSNDLKDKKAKITLRMTIGSILVGLGFGLGGVVFETFLLSIPSPNLRVVAFWGLPCIFGMKVIQVLNERSNLPLPDGIKE